jgi:hypothetical protein
MTWETSGRGPYHQSHFKRFMVGNRQVEVQFHPSSAVHPDYGMSFNVDGYTENNQFLHKHHAMQVLTGVHKAVNEFVDKHKPRYVHWNSHGKKTQLYKKAWGSLMKKKGLKGDVDGNRVHLQYESMKSFQEFLVEAQKSAHYKSGQQAHANGKTFDDNPHLGQPSKAGIRKYTDEAAGSEWARGFRDAKEAKVKTPRPEEMIGAFRRKKSRY